MATLLGDGVRSLLRLSILGGTARRGGSSSRVVLLVTIGAMAVGWSLFFLNDLGYTAPGSSAPRPMFVMKERRGAALSLHGRDIPAPA